MPLQHIPKLHHFFYILPANSWFASQNLPAYSTYGPAHSRPQLLSPLLNTLTLIHPFYKHSHWLTGIRMHQNALLLHTKQMKSILVHTRQMKSLPDHTKQIKHNHIKSSHTRTFTPEDGSKRNLPYKLTLPYLLPYYSFKGMRVYVNLSVSEQSPLLDHSHYPWTLKNNFSTHNCSHLLKWISNKRHSHLTLSIVHAGYITFVCWEKKIKVSIN